MNTKYMTFLLVSFFTFNITAQTNNSAVSNDLKVKNGSISRADASKVKTTSDVRQKRGGDHNVVGTKNDFQAHKFTSEFPKPATKTTSQIEITEIKYDLNNSKSTLENLMLLKELRQNVVKSNPNLLGTKGYSYLVADIDKLKTQFYSEVNTKGFENLTSFEQSQYLAMLKEDGDFDTYSQLISTLK